MSGFPSFFIPKNWTLLSYLLMKICNYSCSWYMKMQIDKLERENRVLKSTSATTTDDIVLQNLLDEKERSKRRLENEVLQLNGDKLALEAELSNLRSGSSIERYYSASTITGDHSCPPALLLLGIDAGLLTLTSFHSDVALNF